MELYDFLRIKLNSFSDNILIKIFSLLFFSINTWKILFHIEFGDFIVRFILEKVE